MKELFLIPWLVNEEKFPILSDTIHRNTSTVKLHLLELVGEQNSLYNWNSYNTSWEILRVIHYILFT